MELAHQILAPAPPTDRTPLVVAHGLFGQGRNFQTLARAWAETRPVVLLDMRNHGASPWDEDVSYAAQAADLARAIDTHCDGEAVVLGHSMGGKAAMALALTHPDRPKGLVVADIAPVAYEHSHAGYVAAMQGLDLGALKRRSEAGAMLAEAVPDAGIRQFLLSNLVFEDGRARWRINLRALGTGMATLTGFPGDWPHAAWDGPALFLHGQASDYVAPETHAPLRARFPRAEIQAIPGAGHWLHAERPEAFGQAVLRWLDTQGL